MDSKPMAVVPNLVPIINVQEGVPGAGERNLRRPQADIKDGEYSVCFERMGMGDLEVVDVDGANVTRAAGVRAAPHAAWQHRDPVTPKPTMSYCFSEWTPSDDSDDDDGGLLDAVDMQEGDTAAASTPWRTCDPPRPKLSFTNVSVISLPAVDQALALAAEKIVLPAEDCIEVGVFSDEDSDDDEVARGAPTPDNTPAHSPSEEHQPALAMEPGSALLSALTGVAMDRECCPLGNSTPTPELSPTVTPTGTLSKQDPVGSTSTLGRVWSRIMGRGGGGNKSQTSPTLYQTRQQGLDSSEEDDDQDDDGARARREIDPRAIDELEATLEEVRLDGDADDPVVSYLVEEAEDPRDAVRGDGPGHGHGHASGNSGDVTVEEVHDEEDTLADPGTSPMARPSGLLSRLFSRSRTGTILDVSPAEATRRPAKRGKTDAPTLHLHRMKPRQPNKAAMRGTLPRILSRWLRQGHGESGMGGMWGAEGDAGEVAAARVGLHTPLPLSYPHPPALQRPRRIGGAQPTFTPPDKDSCSDKDLELKDKLRPEEKHSADLGIQTDITLLTFSQSIYPASTSNTSLDVIDYN